jgi:hypothetical protein
VDITVKTTISARTVNTSSLPVKKRIPNMTNVKIQIIENITKPNTLFSHHHFNIQYPMNEFTY